MKTRKQYMASEVSHDEYYSQFVTPGVIARVRDRIGESQIANSNDPHFNDIPLIQWDNIGLPLGLMESCKLAGDTYSLSFQVCVNKAAARLIKQRVG